MKRYKHNVFASAGSCFAPEKIIKGKIEGISFLSHEFVGTMDGQQFWDKLGDYAHKIGKYVVLVGESDGK